MNDKVKRKLAEQVVRAAHDYGDLKWYLPREPGSVEVEKDDVDLGIIRRNAKLVDMAVNTNGLLQIEVESVSEQKLPWKYHKGSRDHPPEIERASREVFANYVAILEDGRARIEGRVEA